jgi:hypothetical protein
MGTGLPKVKKRGSWHRDIKFSSFIFNNEEIVIDTEEKYIYWDNKFDDPNDKDVKFLINYDCVNYGKLWEAMENFLYVTHRIDDHNWDC